MKRFLKYILVYLFMFGWIVCSIEVIKADERKTMESYPYTESYDRRFILRVIMFTGLIMLASSIYLVEKSEKETIL